MKTRSSKAGGRRRPARKKPLTRTKPKKLEAEELEDAGADEKGFLPEVLDRTVIAIPLLRDLKKKENKDKVFRIVIDLNIEYYDGREGARRRVYELLGWDDEKQRAQKVKTEQYVFAALDRDAIRGLVRRDTRDGETRRPRSRRAIYHIWPDFDLKPLMNSSIRTVKADAGHAAFSAFGDDMVWAVVDSGIDGTHPHFQEHENLDLPKPLRHRDFVGLQEQPLRDVYGHGTHVAGIIAGAMPGRDRDLILATRRHRDENGRPTAVTKPISRIGGMAPRCKILSLKVLDDEGRGQASAVMAALQYVRELNSDPRRMMVHGVNLSVGYPFQPEWFACGQSPLCVEVDRLVKSGVVVVVAAGNSGYGFLEKVEGEEVERVAAGLALTINDPGNADLAVTVGSTHRDKPHLYGVSYFSSKGPTGDGRMKPDLLAPGEKIVSCDSSQRRAADAGAARGPRPKRGGRVAYYREASGTSMAAPHVSGVIAAFLSVRREYIGRPEDVKRIFLSTATSLGRVPFFQGHGLVDMMRAIQSI